MTAVSLSLSTLPGAFLPTVNKSGKVTATAEKVAATLNSMSPAALVGAALTGKGAIGKHAAQSLKCGAVTLESLLSAEHLDGGQWGDLFALLRAEYGVADYNRATMRGRAGVLAYMAAVRTSLVQRFDRAETAKAQDRAYKAIETFDLHMDNVRRLTTAADMAAQAAREAETAALNATADMAAQAAREAETAALNATAEQPTTAE